MIIKSIVAQCKKSKVFQIYEGEAHQYLGDGHAVYPLYKMPRINAETLYTMFDIPEKQQAKLLCKIDPVPENMDLTDIGEGEQHIEAGEMKITYQGLQLIALKCSTGLVFINASYLAPVADNIDIEFYERTIKGKPVIALKSGLIFHGLIMPIEIINDEFMDALQDLTEECRTALENKKFEESKTE